MSRAQTHPKGRIVVAMSGGVDSSVAAALLLREGWEVVGVTLRLYDSPSGAGATPGARTCCAGVDQHDARRVAERLGITHYIFDFAERFRTAVIDDFADGYLAGETPVPCIRCNERVKFDDLLERARDLGAAALATGHYVRRKEGPDGPELHRPLDARRDQSWFLFTTTRAQLDFLRFPLGDLAKSEVRRLAAEFGLPVADKPDSQDICFVPDGRYADLIARLRPGTAEPGDIVDQSGRVLGRHSGVLHYTVGQRRGLGLSNTKNGAETGALYVLRLEPETRRVVVGPQSALAQKQIRLRDVNWLGEKRPVQARPISVRLRSSGVEQGARLTLRAGKSGRAESGELTLDDPASAVAPGQAAIFYEETRILGGGWIQRAAPHMATPQI